MILNKSCKWCSSTDSYHYVFACNIDCCQVSVRKVTFKVTQRYRQHHCLAIWWCCSYTNSTDYSIRVYVDYFHMLSLLLFFLSLADADSRPLIRLFCPPRMGLMLCHRWDKTRRCEQREINNLLNVIPEIATGQWWYIRHVQHADKKFIFWPHRLHAVHKMRSIATDVACSVVCVCVCVSVTWMCCACNGWMPFGGWLLCVQGTVC